MWADSTPGPYYSRGSPHSASAATQECADLAPEGLEVDQKGVVPLEAGERCEARDDAGGLEIARDGLLLAEREQEVRLHADHERGAQGRAPEQGHRVTVRSEVEAVHGARDVQIAVGVEDIHEALSERFEVALNRELGRERVAALPHVFADRLAPEALRPFGGGTIGDGAELARQALPRERRGARAGGLPPPARRLGGRRPRGAAAGGWQRRR